MSVAEDDFDECITDAVDFFGASLTRRPLGDAASAETITGIWEETTSELSRLTGVANLRRGVLKLLAAQTADTDDTFVIDGEVWAVESIGQNGGLQELQLKYVNHERVATGEDVI